MFLRPPLTPETNTAPAAADTDDLTGYEKKLVKRFERKQQRRARLPKLMASLAIASNTLSLGYWADVKHNQEMEAAAEVSINVIAEEPLLEENSHKATVVIDGFNAFDADYLSDKMGDAIRQVADGQVWALGYNNAILQRGDIYEKIIAMAKDRGITHLSIAGYSMGGIVGVETASDLVVESGLEVESLIFISTPDGYDGLREHQKNELAFGQWLSSHIAGSEYSTVVRKAGEVYFYRDTFTEGELGEWWDVQKNAPIVTENVSRFFKTVGEVAMRTSGPKQATMRLLSQQIFKIAQADINGEFEKINKMRGDKQMPVVLYFGTQAPSYDHVVDDKRSSENICTYADKSDLSCSIYYVPGAIHSQYYDTLNEYMYSFDEASEHSSRNIASEAAALKDGNNNNTLAVPQTKDGTAPN